MLGPGLRKLLYAVLIGFALLCVNSVYLGGVTWLEWLHDASYQNRFYQYMFLIHIVLGLALVIPVIFYGFLHGRLGRQHPNRRAVKAGVALFSLSLVLLFSGVVLTRGIPVFEIKNPDTREVSYWLHVAAPFLVAGMFVLHRLAGPRIRWHFGAWVAAVSVAIAVVGFLTMHTEKQTLAEPMDFSPSLATTASGELIAAELLMRDAYCKDCHADVHEQWSHGVHRFASFNNPAYTFTVAGTREKALERDGNVEATRFCAGCHDPVPLFAGLFDDPDFDPDHPTAQAGITCSVCHGVEAIRGVKGNADYVLGVPEQYPFAFSHNESLRWINQTLIKANPEFHKRSYLKPLHRSTEFCGSCHKVHLPVELNHYRWLRGQNHYDAFNLSGVSGYGITSFYYPKATQTNCNGCHMPPRPSDDFAAKPVDGVLSVKDHQFPVANTAIPYLLDMPDWVNERHREFLTDALRLDIFALKHGGEVTGELIGPIGVEPVQLERGQRYLLEVVVRTLKLGHVFTQGTADSNNVWLDVTVTDANGRTVGASGQMNPGSGEVDRWSHFVNAWVIDRNGKRIDRRNAEDIFTVLYNHQIPPGAADSVHYAFTLPDDTIGPVVVRAALRYRKFDTHYYRLFSGDPEATNDLPIVTIAEAEAVLPIDTAGGTSTGSEIPQWQRWNDYGIGLLRKGGTGELRQAEAAFAQVEALGRADGALNAARVYLREGRLDEAAVALNRAGAFDPPAPAWSLLYFGGLVNAQYGQLEAAIENFTRLVETDFSSGEQRLDFSRDYRLLDSLAEALTTHARDERTDPEKRDEFLGRARDVYLQALVLDPERASSHYGLAQVYALLGDTERSEEQYRLHDRYRIDDNARDRAVAAARRSDAAADHAAEPVVIYDLQRTAGP